MKKLTTLEFVNKANIIHNNEYDYSLSYYSSAKEKVIIVCKDHGKFYQTPDNHLQGQGCASCCGLKQLTTELFIERANKVHHNLYDYSFVDYKNSKTNVKIICKKHGAFYQLPCNHLVGALCYNCGKENANIKKSTNIEDFIKQAHAVHSNKYDYKLVNYINAHTKITIICLQHGEFQQKPNGHLSGNNCPRCKGNCISKIEVQWLDMINIPNEYRQKSITINSKKYRIDAYNPITNTIYEFYGDYWHGNPNVYDQNNINVHNKLTFGELYNKTILREQIYKNANHNIVSIWEYDFKKILKESF